MEQFHERYNFTILGAPPPSRDYNASEVLEMSSKPVENDGRNKVLNDFEEVRKKSFKEIIDTGQASIAELSSLATQAQSDKYYAALSSLMKTVSDANFRLLEVQEKIRDIKAKETGDRKPVTNQLIITSAALLDMIKGKK